MGRPSVPDGTRKVRKDGYVLIRRAGTWVYEHHDVMARLLGRPLSATEEVRRRPGERRDVNTEQTLVCWSRSRVWPPDDPTPGSVPGNGFTQPAQTRTAGSTVPLSGVEREAIFREVQRDRMRRYRAAKARAS